VVSLVHNSLRGYGWLLMQRHRVRQAIWECEQNRFEPLRTGHRCACREAQECGERRTILRAAAVAWWRYRRGVTGADDDTVLGAGDEVAFAQTPGSPREPAARAQDEEQACLRGFRKVDEPKAQARFDTSAEVRGGLVTAFDHYEQGTPDWSR
jgi:hypothetical protein